MAGKPDLSIDGLVYRDGGVVKKNSRSALVEDTVYQSGISLTETYVTSSSANYDYDNKSKKIKSGIMVEIEVAYELNDTTTDIEVEIKDASLFGDSEDVITKTFSIQ